MMFFRLNVLYGSNIIVNYMVGDQHSFLRTLKPLLKQKRKNMFFFQ